MSIEARCLLFSHVLHARTKQFRNTIGLCRRGSSCPCRYYFPPTTLSQRFRFEIALIGLESHFLDPHPDHAYTLDQHSMSSPWLVSSDEEGEEEEEEEGPGRFHNGFNDGYEEEEAVTPAGAVVGRRQEQEQEEEEVVLHFDVSLIRFDSVRFDRP